MTSYNVADLISPHPMSLATALASLGWHVFPINRDTKRPAIKEWQKRATTDPDVLEEWFMWSHVGCKVGVLTGPRSGVWVLDVDTKRHNGFRTLVDRWGVADRPDTFIVRTPSGGEHWYFTYPDDGREIKNVAYSDRSRSPLGPGLDVRGRNGQVLAPCQVGYEVVRYDAPIPAWAWLVDLVVKRPRHGSDVATAVTTTEAAHRALEAEAARLATVREPGRNHALNVAAFSLGQLGALGLLRESDARSALLDACRANGLLEGDGEAGCAATFTSGWRAGLGSEKTA